MKEEIQDIIALPIAGENPSEYAERLGIHYTSTVTDEHKRTLGQFFTPLKIALFMSSYCKAEKEKIKILDPGCGIGILSISLIETLITNSPSIKIIELVAFETDFRILPYAESCYH